MPLFTHLNGSFGTVVWLIELKKILESAFMQQFNSKIGFVFPVDERPAGIQDTFLLCPAPVVEEVGR